MMDRTDRHCRFFLRQISRRTLLYTEMVTTGAVLRGDRERHLGFDPAERPLALQLGGDDPAALAECARIADAMGYDEVNLNVGCPSERVQSGRFGACLMAEPARVADSVAAMREAVRIPVTVKHRLGIDDRDRYEDVLAFVDVVAAAGCDRFAVHARKAWLSGLSPRENREIPPLRWQEVRRLKRERPQLRVELNGGVRSLSTVVEELGHVDGVMIGRAAYDDPWLLAGADTSVFGDDGPMPTRREVLTAMEPYVEAWERRGAPPGRIFRHLGGLPLGRPGARAFRRALSEGSARGDAGVEILRAAANALPADVLDEPPALPAIAAA